MQKKKLFCFGTTKIEKVSLKEMIFFSFILGGNLFDSNSTGNPQHVAWKTLIELAQQNDYYKQRI